MAAGTDWVIVVCEGAAVAGPAVVEAAWGAGDTCDVPVAGARLIVAGAGAGAGDTCNVPVEGCNCAGAGAGAGLDVSTGCDCADPAGCRG